VAHTCNPSYSGGSQFKASLGKLFSRPYLAKKSSQKRAGGVAQDVGLSSTFSTEKKKKRKTHFLIWIDFMQRESQRCWKHPPHPHPPPLSPEL
jgi:hypothetical protein